MFGRLLPTGHLQGQIETTRGGVRHLGCRCPLLSLLAEIRGGCAVLLKVAARADEAALRSPVVPRMAIVSPPPPGSDAIQLTGRTAAMGRVIHSSALTLEGFYQIYFYDAALNVVEVNQKRS